MFTILRQRDFGLVWTSALISQLGDWVLIAALPFYVYATTGSILASGATFLAGSLPTLLFGSFAGVFVDRWDRKRLIVIGELAQGAVLLFLLLARTTDTLWIVYAVAFVESTIAVFSSPAFRAAIPQVAGEGQLVRANSLLSAGENFARLVGPPLAGLLMLALSLPGVVVVDAATFFISGALLARISVSLRVAAPAEATTAQGLFARFRQVGREWRDGLRIVSGERWIAILFIVPAISLLGDGMFTAVLAAFVAGVLGGSALVFGWILTARGLGGLIGGVTLGAAGARLHSPRLIGPCSILLGGALLAMAVFRSIPLTMAVMALGGITAIGVFVTISTLLQNGVPDRYRGRVFAAYSTSCGLAVIVGNLLGGVLGDNFGATPIVGVAGALSVLAGVVAVLTLRGETARRAKDGVITLLEADVEPVS
ncbi:MAG TPA: MFS transporter [Ktedonobacterales bacterium]